MAYYLGWAHAKPLFDRFNYKEKLEYWTGMIGGIISEKIVGAWPWPMVAWAWATWLVYAGLLAARTVGNWHGRRAALATMAAFIFLLTTFWGMSWLAR